MRYGGHIRIWEIPVDFTDPSGLTPIPDGSGGYMDNVTGEPIDVGSHAPEGFEDHENLSPTADLLDIPTRLPVTYISDGAVVSSENGITRIRPDRPFCQQTKPVSGDFTPSNPADQPDGYPEGKPSDTPNINTSKQKAEFISAFVLPSITSDVSVKVVEGVSVAGGASAGFLLLGAIATALTPEDEILLGPTYKRNRYERPALVPIDPEKLFPSTIIYRKGAWNAYQLTPRASDDNGLSFQLSVPVKKPYCVTTLEKVNATGLLFAKIDGIDHVSVTPIDMTRMREWQNTKDNANNNPHVFTKLLMRITEEVR